MDDKKLNIKSSTIEKGLEIAKEFLGKLIIPSIEEVGLLMSDKVKYLRFKNQINVLLKARKYVEKRKIKIKELPIKILAPLLESASLEEEDFLQDRWASLLANMADSKGNLQNQVFPFLLSQLSIQEYLELNNLFRKEMEYYENIAQMDSLSKEDVNFFIKTNEEFKERYNNRIKQEQEGFTLKLANYELSNLIRLGLIRMLPPKIDIGSIPRGNNNLFGGGIAMSIKPEARYDTESYGYRITELGQKLIEVCSGEGD